MDDSMEASDSSEIPVPLIKRGRGRPRKYPVKTESTSEQHASDSDGSMKKSPVRRGRGRPRGSTKAKTMDLTSEPAASESDGSIKPTVRRGRGRPRGSINVKATISHNLSSLKRHWPYSLNHEEIDADDHPLVLIPKLCRHMYKLGWATGTGGGVSVKLNDIVYMAPSGVQKEMIKPDHIFKCTTNGDVVRRPRSTDLKLTECAPLFMLAFSNRDAGAVLHSHSKYAVLASLIFKGSEFRITHQEMIKGIKKGSSSDFHNYDDTLVVPVVENVLHEADLRERMAKAMEEYPESNAVLVRRHGVYVWGSTWQRAKTQAECYHYLFEIAVRMKQLGIAPDELPIGEHEIVN